MSTEGADPLPWTPPCYSSSDWTNPTLTLEIMFFVLSCVGVNVWEGRDKMLAVK